MCRRRNRLSGKTKQIEDLERVRIEAIGSGWLVIFEKSHCTLGTKVEREVFLDAHEMVLWVLEHLSSYKPEQLNREKND